MPKPRPRDSSRTNSQRWKKLRKRVLRESDICHICGQPGADSVDHIIPVDVAPELEYVRSNLAPAHHDVPPKCNRVKGNRPYVPGILRKSTSLTRPGG